MNSRLDTQAKDMIGRIDTLTRDMNARFETPTRRIDAVDTDIRAWARIAMQHNTGIAILKDKIGLTDQK